MAEICINGHSVGDGHPPFVIAEVGINHNGEIDRALAMVRTAREAGADAVKFQTFKASEFVGDPNQLYTYRSKGEQVTESMLAMFQRYELPLDAWGKIKSECDRQGMIFLSTPQNRSDLDLLLELNVPAIKVGSDDFTNLPLLKSYAATGLPLIVSCGMADMNEVRSSLGAIGVSSGYPTVLLLCTSQYPTPPGDVNLRKLKTLRDAFPDVTLGYSDHTQGSLAASVATALGATVFEKHFTLSRDLPGPDHWFSEDPIGLRNWISSIYMAYSMLGNSIIEPTSAEREMRLIARRSIVVLCDVNPGEPLSECNVGLRRPGTGLPPEMLGSIVGRVASRPLKAGHVLQINDVV